MRCRMRLLCFSGFLALLGLSGIAAEDALFGQAPRKQTASSSLPSQVGTSRAMLVAGIPGDAEHEEQFARIVKEWRTWLTDSLGFAAADVHILFGRQRQEGLGKPATRE